MPDSEQERQQYCGRMGRVGALWWAQAGATVPYVVASPGARPAEGWAHVMDSRRCTAVAVEGFATAAKRDSPAEIAVDADGSLRLWRVGTKQLRFWLHFVGMPVHAGAATSPQAMLAPLWVEVSREKETRK